MDEYKVAIVIPAYNEESTIAFVVNSVKKYGCPIIVNDASTDGTKDIASQCEAIVVSHKINQGYDDAINTGFLEASKLNFDAVITFDADGQHNSKNIPLFISKLEEGFDLILGVRPKTQRISEWLFKKYMKRRFDWSDPLCGFKGYSMKLYRDRGWFDSYKSIGTELAIYGIVNNYKYVEITINTSPRIDKPRFSSIVTSNLLIVKAMLKSFRVN